MHFTVFFVLGYLVLCCVSTFQQGIWPHLGPSGRKYSVSLPYVRFPLPPSWAGEILIPGKNDELFFWLFAAESSSSSKNLIIWLNGGPGCSSLDGLTSENGPFSFDGNVTTPVANPYSWTKLANVLYIDQPVGVGYSTGSNPATDNADVTQDFYNWLKAFYTVFPTLKTKNTYLMGESYAGVYIPYFADKILSSKELNITLKGLAIGDGTIGNYAAMFDVPVSTYMHQQSKRLGLPQDILNVFSEADQRCGFTQVLDQLTYPPKGLIQVPGNPEGENFRRRKRQASGASNCNFNLTSAVGVQQSIFAACNGGCATYSTAVNYLTQKNPCFSVYNIAATCPSANPNTTFPATTYLNLPAVRTAIHAANKTWEVCNATILDTLSSELVMPPAYNILPRLLGKGVCVHLYSGDQDFLLDHIGTELVVQNMTWNGKQGFEHPPSNSFFVNGKYAGNWGRERGLSYHHILGAGHAVPHDRPAAAFTFVRDFVLGGSK